MSREADKSLFETIVAQPDGQEVAIAYFDKARAAEIQRLAILQSAAEHLALLFTHNRGDDRFDRPTGRGSELVRQTIIAQGAPVTAKYGNPSESQDVSSEINQGKAELTDAGEFNYPEDASEVAKSALENDTARWQRKNWRMLMSIVDSTSRLIRPSEGKWGRYRPTSYSVELAAKASGVDLGGRIFGEYVDDYLPDARYETRHVGIHIFPDGGPGGTYKWATIGYEHFYKSPDVRAMRFVDFSDLEAFMMQPRTPIELADAFFKILEAFSIKIREEIETRDKENRERKANSKLSRLKRSLKRNPGQTEFVHFVADTDE